MKTFEERCMAFMNCPWRGTAGCNCICVVCYRSNPDGFKEVFDEINRLIRQIKASGWKEEDND